MVLKKWLYFDVQIHAINDNIFFHYNMFYEEFNPFVRDNVKERCQNCLIHNEPYLMQPFEM